MKDVINSDKPYDHLTMMSDAKTLCRAFAGRVNAYSIGKLASGRELLCLRTGSGRRRLLFVGTHHGREYISCAYLMREAEALLCKGDKRLAEEFSFYFVPMLNPDGAEISIHGGAAVTQEVAAMKMIHSGWEKWKANANGVDLNRHYPCHFEEKQVFTDVPSSELYKGKAAGSEPEVRALMEFCRKEHFELAETFHAKGEEIFYGDDGDTELSMRSLPLARRLAQLTGYKLMPPSHDPRVYGAGFENWFRMEFAKPCLLFELSPFTGGYTPHDMRRFEDLVYKKAAGIVSATAEFLL